jgi:hypothetical protein
MQQAYNDHSKSLILSPQNSPAVNLSVSHSLDSVRQAFLLRSRRGEQRLCQLGDHGVRCCLGLGIQIFEPTRPVERPVHTRSGMGSGALDRRLVTSVATAFCQAAALSCNNSCCGLVCGFDK